MPYQSRIARFELDKSATRFLSWSVAFMLVYYTFCITDGTFRIFRISGDFCFVFNSMLEHLLRGQFDVDPAAVGLEGFGRDGRTTSYFGVFPALLRLPLAPFGLLETTDVTRISCVLAACLAGWFKLRATIETWRQCPPGPLRDTGLFALSLSIIAGGPQIQFMKVSLYQEPVLWAGAFAAGFIFLAIRALLGGRGFTTAIIVSMAAFAGLGVITRVSTGLGLYVALALTIVVLAWRDRVPPDRTTPMASRLLRFVTNLFAPRNLLAGIIVLAFAAVCGVVNYERWGNPLVFLDYHRQLFLLKTPERIPRFEHYGEFNLARLWFGLMYYFAPVWVLFRPDGHLLFQEFQDRMLDQAELPPSSFLITDPLLMVLMAAYFWYWFRQPRLIAARAPAAALLTGLAVPPTMMLVAISITFRYRGEFYPFFELAAFLGYYSLCAIPRSAAMISEPGTIRLLRRCAIAGVIMAHVMLIFYKFSPFGEVNVTADEGWLRYFYWHFMVHPWF